MRIRSFLFARLLAVAAVTLLTVPTYAEPPSPPPYYAIKNVRVVTGTGSKIDNATVLLADGLIEAVGKNVKVPADAWVIDGEGMTVYPGLIDAMSTLGQKKKERGEGQSSRERPEINGPEDRPETTPWVSAVEVLGDDGKVAKWRKGGFTATVTTPEDGIFAGQAAMINLVDNPDRQAVLMTPTAHRLNFRGSGGFRTFPGSLMGSLAYIKQTLSDVDHYAQVKAAYAKDPRGRNRPEYDRTLEPLEAAFAARTPMLMPANLGREIDRALALQKEFGFAGIIYGGQGAYARADELAKAKVPVLVNLNWPKAEKNRDPEADTPFRTLYHRKLAPTSPAALQQSGVPFAFYSGGLASTAEIFEKVRGAVDAGLSNDAALAALTRNPATIMGVGDRLGTVEKGKIANLVIASDWPWSEDTEVLAVFVDGRKYQERKDDEEFETPAADVSGTWALSMTTPGGNRDMTAELNMDDDGKVKGTIASDQGEYPMDDARMSGDQLRFKTTREFNGRSVTGSWTLTVNGESLSGTMSAGPMQMDISGDRTGKNPDTNEETDNDKSGGDDVTIAELQAAMNTYHGMARPMGTFAITNAQVWTLAGEVIDGGTVIVADGKIKAVGKNLSVPKRAEVIDANGGALIPGIIDCHSHIAIEGGVNEGTLNVTAMAAVGDVVNPDDIGIYRAVAGGVTSANLLHGSANPIGGQNQVVKLRWGTDAEGMKFKGAPQGIKFALGENPKRSNFRSSSIPQRYPQTRMGVMDVIRQAFTDAETYRREWNDYKKGARNGIKPSLPRRDLKMDALVEILEGKRLVHSHCYRADEILQLMRLAEDFGFRVATLQHVLEGYKIADEIAAHGAGASTFSDWWGYKVEAYDAIPHNSALMAERGVVVTINSDSGEEMRHLNQEAAKAVKWGGMSEIEALKLVTLNAAIQLGIDDRVGSIEVGKDADFVLYDGHPLSMRSVVQKTFIDGNIYFDLDLDAKRQATVVALKDRLTNKGAEKGDGETKVGLTRDRVSAPSPVVRWADERYSCREVH